MAWLPLSAAVSLLLIWGVHPYSVVAADQKEAEAFKEVAGNWVLDIEYVRELWKKDQGNKYSDAEWKKIEEDPTSFGCDELRLTEETIAFYKNGKQNVAYPVLGWQVEKNVVWVDYRHFSGGEHRRGFVRDGERLRLINRDGAWNLFSGYRRAAK